MNNKKFIEFILNDKKEVIINETNINKKFIEFILNDKKYYELIIQNECIKDILYEYQSNNCLHLKLFKLNRIDKDDFTEKCLTCFKKNLDLDLEDKQ